MSFTMKTDLYKSSYQIVNDSIWKNINYYAYISTSVHGLPIKKSLIYYINVTLLTPIHLFV